MLAAMAWGMGFPKPSLRIFTRSLAKPVFKRLFIGTHCIDVYRYNQVLFCLNSITQYGKSTNISRRQRPPLYSTGARREMATSGRTGARLRIRVLSRSSIRMLTPPPPSQTSGPPSHYLRHDPRDQGRFMASSRN